MTALRRSAVLLVACAAAAACTVEPRDGPAAPAADPASGSPSAASPSTPPPSAAPSPESPESPESPGSPGSPGGAAGSGNNADPDEGAAADEPLVVVAHHSARGRGIRRAEVRLVAAGRHPRAVDPALAPEAAVRAVAADPSLLAAVPVSAVGPEVRTLVMAGVDPVRAPEEYPLRTEAPTTAEPPGPAVTVTVVGDLMLTRGVTDPAAALRPTSRRLAGADITVGNLENTLSRAGSPTQGGDSFGADPSVVSPLRRAGFDVLGLANNHLGDFGDRALVQTVRRLRSAGFATFGAGRGPQQAWAPAVVERAGVRFGFLGFNAIGETPAVRPGQPGAVSVSMPPRTGPLDRGELRRFLRAVRRLDRRVDAVVVMPHWGAQYTNVPEPVQRRVARRFVASGADVVVGGHPHWLQGVEMVRGRPVFHSLGNFVFDMDFMEQTMEGAFVEMTFWGGQLKTAELVPYVMDDGFAPQVVTGRRAQEVLSLLRETSGPAHAGP